MKAALLLAVACLALYASVGALDAPSAEATPAVPAANTTAAAAPQKSDAGASSVAAATTPGDGCS